MLVDTMFLALALLSAIDGCAAVVDCRVACRRCRDKADLTHTLEVYCAMCTECKERRIERMQAATATTDCHPMQEIVDCPPLSCEDSAQASKVPLKKIVITTSSSTTAAVPTTRRACPAPPCLPPPCYCVPVLSAAPCPCPTPGGASAGKLKLFLPKRRIDYTYVYVGVPKQFLSEPPPARSLS